MKPVEKLASTSHWLRELGAVRPMAAVGDEVLVLGPWTEGFHLIEWRRSVGNFVLDSDGWRINMDPIEQWRIFGLPTSVAMTKEDCQRILRSYQHSINS
jgi:hypothetical protein